MNKCFNMVEVPLYFSWLIFSGLWVCHQRKVIFSILPLVRLGLSGITTFFVLGDVSSAIESDLSLDQIS